MEDNESKMYKLSLLLILWCCISTVSSQGETKWKHICAEVETVSCPGGFTFKMTGLYTAFRSQGCPGNLTDPVSDVADLACYGVYGGQDAVIQDADMRCNLSRVCELNLGGGVVLGCETSTGVSNFFAVSYLCNVDSRPVHVINWAPPSIQAGNLWINKDSTMRHVIVSCDVTFFGWQAYLANPTSVKDSNDTRPTTPSPTTPTTPSITEPTSTTPPMPTTPAAAVEPFPHTLPLAIGAGAAVGLILIIFIIICCVWRNRRDKDIDRPDRRKESVTDVNHVKRDHDKMVKTAPRIKEDQSNRPDIIVAFEPSRQPEMNSGPQGLYALPDKSRKQPDNFRPDGPYEIGPAHTEQANTSAAWQNYENATVQRKNYENTTVQDNPSTYTNMAYTPDDFQDEEISPVRVRFAAEDEAIDRGAPDGGHSEGLAPVKDADVERGEVNSGMYAQVNKSQPVREEDQLY